MAGTFAPPRCFVYSPPMDRNTRQRQAIRRIFEEVDRPLSPQEVLPAAQSYVPGLGIATVYRNLKALVTDGWLESVALPANRRAMKWRASGTTTTSAAAPAFASSRSTAVPRIWRSSPRAVSALKAMTSCFTASVRPAPRSCKAKGGTVQDEVRKALVAVTKAGVPPNR